VAVRTLLAVLNVVRWFGSWLLAFGSRMVMKLRQRQASTITDADDGRTFRTDFGGRKLVSAFQILRFPDQDLNGSGSGAPGMPNVGPLAVVG